MKYKKNILFIILIVSSLCLILLPKSVKGSIADIHYSFENDVIYESNNIEYSNDFNMRNPYSYTEFYKASYSFTNETVGTSSTNITYVDIDQSGAGTTNQIIASENSHTKVLELYDNSGANSALIWNLFESEQPYGSIELWFNTDDITKESVVLWYNDANLLFAFKISGSQFMYYDGAWHNIGKVPINNIWFHIRVDFRCNGAGAYQGLAENDWHIYINGILFGDYNFRINQNNIDRLRAGSKSTDSSYTSFMDGIGYSWLDNYTIGMNMIPTIEIDGSTQEVDRFEYALSGVNVLYPFAYSNPSGWTETENGDGLVFVDGIFDPNYNREISFITGGGASVLTFYRDNFGSTANFINITTSFYIISTAGANDEWFFMIDSSDGSQITALYVDLNTLNLYYDYDGLNLLRNDLAVETLYEYNLFINYESDSVVLLYYIDGVFTERYTYPLDIIGKNGLKRVEYALSVDGLCGIIVDYTGVYENGKSMSIEYGYQTIDLNSLKAWNFRDNNLFTIFANGYIHLGAVQGVYIPEETMDTIRAIQNYNNNTYFFNIYDNYVSSFPDPRIVATIKNDAFNISSILIEGVKLTEGLNEYYLEYSHSGIEIETSYFYVDENNKLQFTLIANDTDTEYIQATFDIPDLSSTDRAISFRGSIIDKAFGYFIVDYIAGLTTVDIPIIERTTRNILPTNKTIDNLIILITDNDIDSITGITTGYVSQPILLSISGIGLPIITAGLIEMMIPLIMIMIPTLLISQGFGKEGKKLIIPLFLVFSIITTITLIIPVWILFIIIFGVGLFLARNKEIEVK